jgi:hypothetical protein
MEPEISDEIRYDRDKKPMWRDFMRFFVATFGVTLIIILAGCHDSGKNDEDSGTRCTIGDKESCQCSDGKTTGTRVCLNDNKYTDCDCNQSIICNNPGEVFKCTCANGGDGDQVCTDEGVRSACNCPKSGKKCCHELGTCIAKKTILKTVSESTADGLGEDSCGSSGELLCVPDDLTSGSPEICKSVLDSEGRCLPDCLPEIANSKPKPPQSSCPEHFLCVPCFDPLTGAMTDACITGTDSPRSVGKSFESCCSGNGHCVPVDLLDYSAEQLAPLGKDSCDPDQNALCIPQVLIENPNFTPEVCTSIASSEGRCLPKCLPGIEKLPLQLPQDICTDDFVCAPCYDPITGELTDACTMPNDPGPSSDAVVFDTCCKGSGSCVTKDVLTEDQSLMLGEDNCEKDKDLLCVPSVFTSADGYKPQTCVSLNRNEGRCVPDCLPDVVNAPTAFPKDICDDHFVCAPCYDPITLRLTAACTIDGDTPKRTPLGYDTCCDGLGSCIDKNMVPDDAQSCLDEDVCGSSKGVLCVPNEMVDFNNYLPQYCTSIFNSDGYCAPNCVPDAKKLAWKQDVCPKDYVCLPYKNPLTGEDNQCHINFPDNKEWNHEFEFPTCCKSAGTCVPLGYLPTSIDPSMTAKIPTDTCPSGRDYRCVPNSMITMLENGNIKYKACGGVIPISTDQIVPLINIALLASGSTTQISTAMLAALGISNITIPEGGICLSTCLLVEQDTSGLIQDICNADELCVPCAIAGVSLPGSCVSSL